MSRTAPAHMPPPKPNKACHPPDSKIGAFLWKRWIWVEGTFALSMFEPWEKVLLLSILFFFFSMTTYAIYQYLPQHVALMSRRAVYYIWGTDGDERMLWQWSGLADIANGGRAPSGKIEL